MSEQPLGQLFAGHILTVQSNQFCAVHEAEYAVQVPKLCSPKRQIVKNLVNRCEILRLKCTDSILARALSQTRMEELTVALCPPDSTAGFKGPSSEGRERKKKKIAQF